MIVVTGAAGFIGSCLVAELNSRGRYDLILVDDLKGNRRADQVTGNIDLIVVDHLSGDEDPKKKNLAGKRYHCYYDKAEYLKLLEANQFDFGVECILHMGACSSTILADADYFEKNNFEYSCCVAQWALKNNVRLIYASSAATYGNGALGYSDDESLVPRLKPLNLYGESKQKFDKWVLERGYQRKMTGLKFFNVFGPNEYHKGDMRSVVSKAYERVVSEGKISLFKSYNPKYKDGEQMRDFIYVKDAVDVVMFFMENPSINGIFNLGTGRSRTWNDLAHALFGAVGRTPNIAYIEMPEILRGRYQYFTQADMTKLRKAGYTKAFTSLEDAVKDYCGYLSTKRYL